jgi:hypothetical protein
MAEIAVKSTLLSTQHKLINVQLHINERRTVQRDLADSVLLATVSAGRCCNKAKCCPRNKAVLSFFRPGVHFMKH